MPFICYVLKLGFLSLRKYSISYVLCMYRLLQIGEKSEIIQKQQIVTAMESHLSSILMKLFEHVTKAKEMVEG